MLLWETRYMIKSGEMTLVERWEVQWVVLWTKTHVYMNQDIDEDDGS